MNGAIFCVYCMVGPGVSVKILKYPNGCIIKSTGPTSAGPVVSDFSEQVSDFDERSDWAVCDGRSVLVWVLTF